MKNYQYNKTAFLEGDGEGTEWLHALSIKDKSLADLTGAQIPIEPSYFIMNTAVSSTWGFPYDVPEWCGKCYDCNDPQCACSFYPGFCKMLESRKTAMYIDFIRLYQTDDDSAHVGQPHSLTCDPPQYPTREWIHGHSYRYMRNPPFSYDDKDPLRRVQRGGGSCKTDADCGSNVKTVNATAVNNSEQKGDSSSRGTLEKTPSGRGRCLDKREQGVQFFFSSLASPGLVCVCNPGFTGPHCLSLDQKDDTIGAWELHQLQSPFHAISSFEVPVFMMLTVVLLTGVLLVVLVRRVSDKKKLRNRPELLMKQPLERSDNVSLITGTSI